MPQRSGAGPLLGPSSDEDSPASDDEAGAISELENTTTLEDCSTRDDDGAARDDATTLAEDAPALDGDNADDAAPPDDDDDADDEDDDAEDGDVEEDPPAHEAHATTRSHAGISRMASLCHTLQRLQAFLMPPLHARSNRFCERLMSLGIGSPFSRTTASL